MNDQPRLPAVAGLAANHGRTAPLPERTTWYGRDEPLPERLELRAGPLALWLEDGDLRCIRLGDVEIARRVYVAVRATNWDTAPGVRSSLSVDRRLDSFHVSYASQHRLRDIAFVWLAEIEGTADGTITFSMRGAAEATFDYGRIGLCVLHPPATSAGRPFRAATPDGTVGGRLPTLIEPQRKDRGLSLPLFPWFTDLRIMLDDAEVDFEFRGDLFGVEDQRNWTDASFKTYSTPPIRERRHHAVPGDGLEQSVRITVRGPSVEALRVTTATGGNRLGAEPAEAPSPRRRRSKVVATALSVGPEIGVTMPRLGLGIAAHGGALSPREVDLIGRLRLDHVRADLRLWEPACGAELTRAAGQASALACRLELALFVSDDGEAELTRLAEMVAAAGLDPAGVARVLMFHEPGAAWTTTAGRWVGLARGRLARLLPGARFGGGTNGYFAELSRTRPEIDAMDVVSYTANPQVHAFDERSLVENLETLATTVRTARSFCADREIAVSRLTLKPPFNQDEPDADAVTPGELPTFVDPRQMSLFGAGWTAGALKYLADGGAGSVTLYETTGWNGLIEQAGGCSLPERFPSRPGMVFPMYHVLADLARWTGTGRPAACVSTDPLSIAGLAMRRSPGPNAAAPGGPVARPCWGLVVANLSDVPRRVTVRVVDRPVGAHARVRYLDGDTAHDAMFAPERFRSRWSALDAGSDRLWLDLRPYALACVEESVP
jgi:hypothetical protein